MTTPSPQSTADPPDGGPAAFETALSDRCVSPGPLLRAPAPCGRAWSVGPTSPLAQPLGAIPALRKGHERLASTSRDSALRAHARRCLSCRVVSRTHGEAPTVLNCSTMNANLSMSTMSSSPANMPLPNLSDFPRASEPINDPSRPAEHIIKHGRRVAFLEPATGSQLLAGVRESCERQPAAESRPAWLPSCCCCCCCCCCSSSAW